MSEKTLAEVDFTIIGLGLMGGSLAAALTGKVRSICAVDPNPAALQFALQRGWIDRGETRPSQPALDSDCVVLAAPVRANLAILAEISHLLPSGCLLLDLSSTKAEIVSAMQNLPAHVQPLGGHPMCGKESQGIENADPQLFAGRVFFLTPLPRTSTDALLFTHQLVDAIQARPVVVDAANHDRAVAAVSALPYLLAGSLTRTVQHLAHENPLVWQAAASGFRDTSRLAASDTTMMLNALTTNPLNTLHALRTCQADLQILIDNLESGDTQTLVQRLEQSKLTRRKYQE